jgi:ribosome-binding protein aMBF1 (putative translation factor)
MQRKIDKVGRGTSHFTVPCFSHVEVSMQYVGTRTWHKLIKYERLSHGWSQEEAAELLGVDERTLRDWEAGKHFPGYSGRRALSTLYNKTIQDLGLLDPIDI